MMNELQVKKSNIWHWVSSIRIPNRKNSPNHSMARASDYEPRCTAIRKKIGILISAMDESTKKTNGSRLAVRIGTTLFQGEEILRELHSAIGVYNIKRLDESKIGPWTQHGTFIVGDEWLDYLGDQSIRKGGGHIVVMLSDEGVTQLNEIAHALYPFVQSSVTT
jgi:hypothetical protein